MEFLWPDLFRAFSPRYDDESDSSKELFISLLKKYSEEITAVCRNDYTFAKNRYINGR